eukprot:364557-Chlamydomonas_euryale.AAC.32
MHERCAGSRVDQGPIRLPIRPRTRPIILSTKSKDCKYEAHLYPPQTSQHSPLLIYFLLGSAGCGRCAEGILGVAESHLEAIANIAAGQALQAYMPNIVRLRLQGHICLPLVVLHVIHMCTHTFTKASVGGVEST